MKNIEDFYPLSPMQQGILFHSLYAPSSDAYFEQFSCTIHGNLNVAVFKQAWQQLLRHPVLRTSFVWEGLKEPVQVVHKQVKLPWEQQDLRSLAAIKQQERVEAFLKVDRERGFDLSQAPLIRLTLLQLAEDEYQFIWSRHHLPLDGWSSSVIFEEVFASYKALSQGEDLRLEQPRPFRDYIAWLQQQDLSQAEIFWRQRLKGFTAATSLRVDQTPSRPLNPEKNYDRQLLQLSTAATAALQFLARQQQLTLNTLVQGAWALLLSRYGGENDVVFGAVVSGRPLTLAGAEAMVGLFVNTIPVRSQINPEECLLPWLKKLQTQQTEARQYEYSPLVEVQKWSDIAGGQPLFESILNFQNYPMDFSSRQRGGNLEISEIRHFAPTHYPLTVTVEVHSELVLEIVYDCHRFDTGTITRMLKHFQTLLEGMTANPEQRIADLPLLTDRERQTLLGEWNDTQTDYPQQCIHELFEAQVRRTPDAIAVVFEDRQLTYQELNRKANQLAHHLQALGVGPEVLVGICVERSLALVVGLLGILKAGGAYVPLDPAYPQERLAFMLLDSQTPLLLTQQQLLARLPEHEAQVICFDKDWETLNEDNPVSSVTSKNLAYVIYTSGSTGKPKGVQIPHGGVVNFLKSMEREPGLTDSDVLLSITSISFDIAALELYLPLITGARLVIVSREVAMDGKQLSENLTASGATVMQATPATWHLLLATEWQGSSQLKILCGGEALPSNLAKQLLEKGASLWNLYGPTETTIWSTAYKVEATKLFSALVPIGHPISNTQIYLLDSLGQPVPVGIPGELHIGGVGLARGYLNRPDLTAQKFILNPFEHLNAQPTRVYKTGDLARYLSDGTIEYIGRIDHQVKLRGFRIELGEIETVLSQHPAVRQAVVTAREDESGNKRLVAYLVGQASLDNITHELRSFVEKKLPDYMVPSAFVWLQTLPLTPNGKVNRRALPAPSAANSHLESSFVAPREPVEEVLAGIWVQVLGVEVGVYDNFFELGGHSLLAMQVISRIWKTFEVEIPLRCLFESPTVAGIAEDIHKAMKAEPGSKAPPIKHVSRDGELPLSFAQARLWYLEQLQPGSAYNTSAGVRLVGSLNVAVLEQSIGEIVRRHEALRTTFSMSDGQPFQAIAKAPSVRLPVVDLRGFPDAEREAQIQRLLAEEPQQTFDLAQGPLLRCTLLRVGSNEHVVLFTIHHIVSDGWSMGVFIRELAALYEAFCAGKPSPLPELPIQYVDFAVWQRQWLQGEVLEAQLAYWKKQLGHNLPVLQLPTVRPRAEVKTSRGATTSFVIPSNLSDAIQKLSRQEGVTLFMTLLAGFQVLLQRYTNQDDIVVGTDVANRNRAETESLIGFFVNLLVLRTDLSGNPSFRELLLRVREVALGAYAHQDLPFEKLVEVLAPRRNSSNTPPLFQVLFVLQNAPMPALELPGLSLKLLDVENKMARFDLALFLTETEQGIVGEWKYNADLFEANNITRMSGHFETLLKSIVAQPDTRINTLEILSDTEREQQAVKKRQHKASKLKKFMAVQPKAVELSQDKLVETNFFQHGERLLVITPNDDNVDIVDWASSNREFIETKLLEHGAILFRNFGVPDSAKFESFAEAICPGLFGEYGDLPREGVSGKVYGSTPYPSDQAILFHNESSHMHCWPQKIWFFCVQPAQKGGETPIVDSRKVLQLLEPKLREKFASKQLMYVRNYTDGLDVSWQEFFRTTDRAEVEEYCRKASIAVEWKSDGGLRTRQVRPAVVKHPKTGEPVFFNQIQLHHPSCLKPDVRESLLSLFGEDNLPRHVYYGDRSGIEDSAIEAILAVYEQAKVSFPWQQGDILMLDNMLTAHGRNPYVGSRKIVVAMGDMIHSADIEHKGMEKAYAN